MSDRARLAALKVHSLGQGDQQWVLERLHEDERECLSPLLTELRSQKIRVDRETLDQLPGLAPKEAVIPDSLDRSEVQPSVDELDRKPARAIAMALEREADSIIGTIVGFHDWRWREQLLQLLPASRRVKVMQIRGQRCRIRPAAQLALLRALEDSVSGAMQGALPPASSSRSDEFLERHRSAWMAGLLRWLR